MVDIDTISLNPENYDGIYPTSAYSKTLDDKDLYEWYKQHSDEFCDFITGFKPAKARDRILIEHFMYFMLKLPWNQSRKVLDLGCGKHKRKYVVEEASEYISVDRFKSTKPTIIGDIEDLTLVEQDYFDIVLCIQTLEHTYEPEHVIGNIMKWKKSNGIAILAMPWFEPIHGSKDKDGCMDYKRLSPRFIREFVCSLENNQYVSIIYRTYSEVSIELFDDIFIDSDMHRGFSPYDFCPGFMVVIGGVGEVSDK